MSNLLPGTRERVLVPFGMPSGGEPNYRRGDSRFQSGVRAEAERNKTLASVSPEKGLGEQLRSISRAP